MIKAVVILSIVAVASAGVVYDSAHVGAQSEQTVRGLGAFGQSTVSHQAKQVNSAFSSVSKSDTRVTNPALAVGVQPAVAYAAQPAYGYQQAVAAPVYQQQLAYAAQPAVQYAAQPAVQYAAQPAVVAAPVAKAVSYAAPSVTGSQVYSHQPAAPVAYAAQPAVAYAAQPAVATYAAPVAKAVARVPSASYTGNAVAQPARVAAVAAPVAYAQPQYAAAPVAYHQPGRCQGRRRCPSQPSWCCLLSRSRSRYPFLRWIWSPLWILN